MAANVRLAPFDAVADLPTDHFDGLSTFEDLPSDGRRVRDYWAWYVEAPWQMKIVDRLFSALLLFGAAGTFGGSCVPHDSVLA